MLMCMCFTLFQSHQQGKVKHIIYVYILYVTMINEKMLLVLRREAAHPKRPKKEHFKQTLSKCSHAYNPKPCNAKRN